MAGLTNKKHDWIVVEGDLLLCLRCQTIQQMQLPVKVSVMCAEMKLFTLKHKDCTQARAQST